MNLKGQIISLFECPRRSLTHIICQCRWVGLLSDVKSLLEREFHRKTTVNVLLSQCPNLPLSSVCVIMYTNVFFFVLPIAAIMTYNMTKIHGNYAFNGAW